MELIEGIASGQGRSRRGRRQAHHHRDHRRRGASCANSSNTSLKIKQGAAVAGINFDVSFDNAIHDRSIVTDTGWKILLGRGLDIFHYVTGDAFNLATKLQEFRQVRAFGLTYIREAQ